ncbi:unnamed protein product [Triticum turgidum subsp. durum]|uniref:L-ascorbate oxidase n=1 Tax=Triticum turgidum subsp. durum TaxID=4567 RepID=A0A9R0R1T9_TRITD|nr:unnamed protein product [Triticum turgidum subsp. durum]
MTMRGTAAGAVLLLALLLLSTTVARAEDPDHAVMASLLDAGRNFGRPAGVLINGRGGKEAADPPMFTWEAAKTYQLRICNVGIKSSLNFRIQGHDMKLVEMDGSHTIQGMYESLDPQGSYHYGQINITRTIKLMVTRGHIDGKLRYGFNGVSHVDADTPLKLAEYFNVSDQVFKYNQMGDEPPAVNGPMHVVPNVISAEFRTFIEVVFENPEKSMESVHIDGYAFFAVGMGPGKWTPAERKTYNLLDAVSRHTIQVYPRSWSAVMLTFDNAGMWNVRTNLWERHYLGEQLYMSVVSPARSLRDEYNMPENALRCGKVVGLPMPPSYLPA